MTEESRLPTLVVKTDHSQFQFRCHAAAWAQEYGGILRTSRRNKRAVPGLLMLSVTGPDTAVKSLRATLYQSALEAEFQWSDGETNGRLLKARLTEGAKPVTYHAAVAKLAGGVIHLVALAGIPGLLPKLSDDHLWAELSSPQYTTPLLRSWTGWLLKTMAEQGNIVVAEGFSSQVGVLNIEPDDLDELVIGGVQAGHLPVAA